MDLGTKKRKRTDDDQGQNKRSKITNAHLHVRSYLAEIVSHLQLIVDKISVSTYQQNDLEMAFLERVEGFYALLSDSDYKNEQAIDILGDMYGCVTGIIKALPSTEEKQEDKPVIVSRFAAIEDTNPVVNLSAEYLKLNRMIELFCIKRSNNTRVSQSLGATYSALSEYPVAKENLFFTLEESGFKVYASCLENLQVFKLYLENIGFQGLMCTTQATAPSVSGFEHHQQYITISHLQVGKLLALHSRKEKPQIALRDIYHTKKLDPVKCRFFATRAKVFEETDADFYKNCFKNLQKKSNGQKIELLNGLIEDTHFDEMDHRRYLLALLEVQQKFLALPQDQQILLPKELYQALIGLRSQLILAENDESAGLSKRLSRHFHQVYEIDHLEAKAPFVIFTQEGCCFYLDSPAAAKQLEEQFTIHGLTCHLALDEKDLRKLIHHVNADDYPHKLVVKPCSNRELLNLGRIHPANIDIALKQAYANQKLDFISVLLSAAANGDRPPARLVEEKSVVPQSSGGFLGFSWLNTLMGSSAHVNTTAEEKIQLSYQTAILKNGEKIIGLNLQTPPQQNHQNMGEVFLVLDNSGSMSGQKIEAAKQACINLIQELPPQAQITLWTFNQTPIFDGVLKSNLPYNWQKSILSIVADKSTPLVETITRVGARITPNRSFVPSEKLKEVLFIVATDGEGDHQETAEEVQYALETGMFRKQDVSLCNHSLGTPLLPNHGSIPIILIGIGTGYKSAFVNGLGNFGSYHIRDNEHMHNDLFEMTEKVKKTFGKKIGPIYVGLMKDGQPIFTVCKDMMLPGSTQCQYTKVSGEVDLSKLQACSFVNNDFNSEILVETQNNHVLEAYFKSMIDRLFNELATQVNARASSATFGQADRFGRSTLPIFAPITDEQSLYQPIKDKFAQLEQEMADNDIFDLCPSLQQEVVYFKQMIVNAEQSRIDHDDWRRRQAQVTRGERFSDESNNGQTQNKTKFGIF